MEMMKLVVAPHAVPTLIAMTDAGLLLRVLGGVTYLGVVREHGQGRGGDRRSRPIPCAGSARSRVMVAEDAERLWQKLRLTNAEHERLASMAEGWRRISPAFGEQAARALLYRLGPQHFTDHALLGWARSPATAHDADLARAGDPAAALDRAGVSAEGGGLHRARRRERPGARRGAARGGRGLDRGGVSRTIRQRSTRSRSPPCR